MEQLRSEDPRRIGPYELVGRVGVGGMGRVYLGRSADGTQAAVKVIHEELAADPQFRRRFAREVKATRAVSGLYVAAILDADADAEQPWLATEYVSDPSLASVLDARTRLEPEDARALAVGAAEGLAVIHRAGLVHRDVKPSNIMMTASGPKLIDFGIARDLAASRLTRTGTALGTPTYMAPEQLKGEPVGAAADVFALGAVLVTVLTGRFPFGQGDAAQMLFRITFQEPELDDVPDEFRPLVRRCLDKDPAKRPSTAEIISVLGYGSETHRAAPVVLAGTAGLVVPPAPEGQGAVPTEVVEPRRRRTRAVYIATIATLCAVGLAVMWGLPDKGGANANGSRPPTAGVSGGSGTTTTAARGGVVVAGASLSDALPSLPASPGRPSSASTPAATTTSVSPTRTASTGVPSKTTSPTTAHVTTSVAPGGAPTTTKAAPPPTTTTQSCTKTTVPCLTTSQDSTPHTLKSLNNGLCLAFTTNPGYVPTGDGCSDSQAQLRDSTGTGGTAQFASLSMSGYCVDWGATSPYTHATTCSDSDPQQWFVVAPAGGSHVYLEEYGNTATCLSADALGNIVNEACSASTSEWQLGAWPTS